MSINHNVPANADTCTKKIYHTSKGIVTHRGGDLLPRKGENILESIIEFIKKTVIGIITATLTFGNTTPALSYTQDDINLLAEVIYWENWHTDKKHLAAYYTGAVVMNRVHSDDWPNTIESVLYQKNPRQYSTTGKFFTVELPEECYEMAEDILKNGTPDVPENIFFQAQFKQGKIWKEINGEIFCYG